MRIFRSLTLVAEYASDRLDAPCGVVTVDMNHSRSMSIRTTWAKMGGGRAVEGCGETGEERRGGREGVEKKEEKERG
jgi:hypothetical protein